jgi:hypothetical protein
MDVLENIEQLFNTAKAADEFEFCCTLLRIRGLESPGWDPLQESISLIDQLLALIEAPIQESLQYRLILMLYCHITEMNDLYNILGNLILELHVIKIGTRWFYSQTPNIRLKKLTK